ncbi:SMI1/KNR4 family protein [Roseimicrobium sp. ORNL1]|uniref:SMI1/KNR4 family protein n=1 Tax=Roseimicrobium sp. ORNL1 TaxID=2711231 RepID=UPI0013E1969D|nr:SMI1/KNR4 family protein [Roseimicrobium sp. ORNL1]QIF03197.1 hypothetical protein G5S37_17260 [Roseimicrobium sp. ORNL1]
MYLPYFDAASRFLEKSGIPSEIHNGRQLAEHELKDLSSCLGLEIPGDLAVYLQELGDGFSMQWELAGSGDLVSFGLSPLVDIQDEGLWIQQQMRETLTTHAEDAEIVREAKRRMHWIPIMGIGEGGQEFCLDTSDGSVRFHQSYWKDHRNDWLFGLAPSLRDLVTNWSRYCFSDPITNDGAHINMTILAERIQGEFDWASKHFHPAYLRDAGTH